ncbi:MAG: hypothetical protein NPIRA02_37810 [Nitrospirales bacterium]|nr:MAG: hypothetical protein NPIRA02_37810 [Nitrospirales bacterium]
MASSNLKNLKDFLEKGNFDFLSDIREGDTNIILANIPVSKIGKRIEKDKTSKHQLKDIQKRVKNELGIKLEILIFKEQEQEEIEIGLSGLLRKELKESFMDSSLSFLPSDYVDVWVSLKKTKSHSSSFDKEKIKEKIVEYLGLFDKNLKQLHWEGSLSEWPSKLAILRQIKILQPAKINELRSQLIRLGFPGITLTWLRKKLDLLRRQEMLLRLEDKSYALTGLGLKVVPHGKNRSSSDIERTLALGRRTW